MSGDAARKRQPSSLNRVAFSLKALSALETHQALTSSLSLRRTVCPPGVHDLFDGVVSKPVVLSTPGGPIHL